MRPASETFDEPGLKSPGRDGTTPTDMALVVLWCRDDARRVGEVATLRESEDTAFGREPGADHHVLSFYRERGGVRESTAAFAGKRMSRRQLLLRSEAGQLHVKQVGRCPMLVGGAVVDEARLRSGDLLHLDGELTFLCTRREHTPRAPGLFPVSALGAFGEVDEFGLLGESPALQRVRESLAWHAKSTEHLLILGPSGVGKELAARALHTMSSRANRPFVARNAATIPSGLVDAELFGNLRNYPNPGSPERPGLLGEAQGGVLFLDEIAEVPESMHAHLLRVLDDRGEYHRLGESLARRADVRLFAATNRGIDAIKHDLAARIPLRIVIPGLNERREDIPLLARHLLRLTRHKSPELAARFFDEEDLPRFSAGFVDAIVTRDYSTHVRELRGLLWRAMADSPDDMVMPPRPERPPSTRRRAAVADSAAAPAATSAAAPPPELTADHVREALRRHGGNATAAARELGLSSRFVLYRRMKKLNMDITEARVDDD